MEKAKTMGVKRKKATPTSSKLILDGELSMPKSHSKKSAEKDKPIIDKTLFVTRLILINPSKNVTQKKEKNNKLIHAPSSVFTAP
jgi:hypothetical protein